MFSWIGGRAGILNLMVQCDTVVLLPLEVVSKISSCIDGRYL